MKWKIYYSDETTYSDLDGSPFYAPTSGVIAIVTESKVVGKHVFARQNHYWWTEKEGWLGGDLFGMYDYHMINGPQKVIHGRTVSNLTYNKILEKLLKDDYFPPKSAKESGECY